MIVPTGNGMLDVEVKASSASSVDVYLDNIRILWSVPLGKVPEMIKEEVIKLNIFPEKEAQ